MANVNRHSNAKNQGFWRFSNWKSWLASIVVIALSIPIFRYLKRQFQLNRTQQERIEKDDHVNDLNNNPLNIESAADKVTKDKFLQSAALKLAKDFGFLSRDTGKWYDWLNPKGFTENDTAIANTLIKYKRNYTYLKRLYFVYTNSRNLTTDIYSKLDTDQLQRVKKHVNIT